MPSKGKTIKMHKQQHIKAFIMRLGVLVHYDAQFFEGAHRLTKRLYRATNMRLGTHIAAMILALRTRNLAKACDNVDLNEGEVNINELSHGQGQHFGIPHTLS